MIESVLEVVDCHTYYGQSYVLQGISMAVPSASVVALLGRNGVGKTTLVRSIMGLTPPRSGLIRFEGREISGLRPEQISRLGVGFVPQGRRIFPSLRVRENLMVAAKVPSAGGWTEDAIYELFPILRERSRSWGDELSGGEQQMLAIGRALIGNPRMILMDEPLEGLSPATGEQVLEVIRRLKREGTPVLLVEQRVDAALSVADRLYVMNQGKIVHEGVPADFRDRSALWMQHIGVS